jgi:hypothetical protein
MTTSEKLEALAADLQAVYRWGQENTDKIEDIVFDSMGPYTPSEAVLKQSEAQAKYHKFAKNFSYGEY